MPSKIMHSIALALGISMGFVSVSAQATCPMCTVSKCTFVDSDGFGSCKIDAATDAPICAGTCRKTLSDTYDPYDQFGLFFDSADLGNWWEEDDFFAPVSHGKKSQGQSFLLANNSCAPQSAAFLSVAKASRAQFIRVSKTTDAPGSDWLDQELITIVALARLEKVMADLPDDNERGMFPFGLPKTRSDLVGLSQGKPILIQPADKGGRLVGMVRWQMIANTQGHQTVDVMWHVLDRTTREVVDSRLLQIEVGRDKLNKHIINGVKNKGKARPLTKSEIPQD